METYKTYISVCAEIKKLEAQKKQLKALIVEEMNRNNELSVNTDTHTVSKRSSARVSYDYDAISSFLFNKGLDIQLYTSQKLDMDKVEYLVANNTITPEELMGFAKVTEFYTLTANSKRGSK
jgi:3-isopropylmalate dehydratase small subunit